MKLKLCLSSIVLALVTFYAAFSTSLNRLPLEGKLSLSEVVANLSVRDGGLSYLIDMCLQLPFMTTALILAGLTAFSIVLAILALKMKSFGYAMTNFFIFLSTISCTIWMCQPTDPNAASMTFWEACNIPVTSSCILAGVLVILATLVTAATLKYSAKLPSEKFIQVLDKKLEPQRQSKEKN